MSEIRTLAIVSHVVHYEHDGALAAYGPYAREIDVWADLFPDIVIAAPCRREAPPADALPFTRPNIRMAPQRERGGDTWRSKGAQLLSIPAMTMDLARVLKDADAIHVRCPGNLGLLGVVLAPLFSRRVVAKYAGQWNGFAGESLAGRLQRRILASSWWKGPVTVYGQWPAQPAHVVPFFTSMMTEAQVRHAAASALSKQIATPLRVVFSGTLAERKRVGTLITAVGQAISSGTAIELTIVGDGPERGRLTAQVEALGLGAHVRFTGALPFDAVQPWYEWGHCLVLPSTHSEGWPKALAEAMNFGLVGIAVSHGQIPWMLEGRGVVLPTGTAAEISAALRMLAADPVRAARLGRAASSWAAETSLEKLRDALAGLLTTWWSAPITLRNGSVLPA